MQEGEANARLQGFCRLHCDVFSVLWLCSHVDGGGCWGRDVCWQLSFTELALALKVEGQAVVSAKLSSLRSHTTDPRVASGSRLEVQQQCLWKGLLPVEPFSLCAPQRDTVESGSCSKGSSSQRTPKHLGSLHREEG